MFTIKQLYIHNEKKKKSELNNRHGYVCVLESMCYNEISNSS